jgi:hypothetical protein
MLGVLAPGPARGQDESLITRPGPKPLETFEDDEDGDGIPDGWYNLRDAKVVKGGMVGKGKCLRFETDRPSRGARASRAFGVDGRKTGAMIMGLWVRVEKTHSGERMGEDPGLLLNMYDEELIPIAQANLGPWTTESIGDDWVRVAKRIAVPPRARDAIFSIGLLGATGVLEVDGLTVDLIPVDEPPTRELVLNGGFELGDPSPASWSLEKAKRTHPGRNSDSAVELRRFNSRALTTLGLPVDRLGSLDISATVRANGLRAAGGAGLRVFFLDAEGQPLINMERGVSALRWGDSFAWRTERARVNVPGGAARAILQLEKEDGNGFVTVDDVKVVATDRAAGTWRPYHVADDAELWRPFQAAEAIEPGSALDGAALLDAPAGKHGRVVVRDGHLAFEKGGRARFFGVTLLPKVAFDEPAKADALADRLARSGVNLVRLGDLDAPLGPAWSLFDDARDDTRGFDPVALDRLDHLIAALKARGIYVAVELASQRRFRAGDGLKALGPLPPGGGAAAAFDPDVRDRALEAAQALLGHVNAETHLALRDDPALAWVTLAGELSLFDHSSLTVEAGNELRRRAQAIGSRSSSPKFWQALETSQWQAMAEALRKDGLKAPIAGCSHWHREPEFAASLGAPGLSLIDDRLFWNPFTVRPFADATHRSLLWDPDDSLVADVDRKRRAADPDYDRRHRPSLAYVAGQFCDLTHSWATPFDGGELLLAALTARLDDWDGLVRRGVAPHPVVWGSGSAGTGGGTDLFVFPEAINGDPQVFALLPHASTLVLRGPDPIARGLRAPGNRDRDRGTAIPGWDPSRGRLVIDTPHTQGLVGWPGGVPADCADLNVDVLSTTERPFAVVVASALGSAPIARSSRILVTAVARFQPTGFAWNDSNRVDVADSGRRPLLQEPVRARVVWKHSGRVRAFALDSAGKRVAEAPLTSVRGGVRLDIDGSVGGVHWELVAE